MNPYLFWLLFCVVMGGAFGVIRAANIFHAGLCLALTFGAVAGVYALLGAHFVAAVQLLIYVGAIAVILKFAVMLTQHIDQREVRHPFMRGFSTFLVVALFAAMVLVVIFNQQFVTAPYDPVTDYVGVKAIGERFLSQGLGGYLLPFEMVGMLLLMALVGAVMVASKEREKS